MSQSLTTMSPTNRTGDIMLGSMNTGSVVNTRVRVKIVNSANTRVKMKKASGSDCRRRRVSKARRSTPKPTSVVARRAMARVAAGGQCRSLMPTCIA